MVPKEKKSLFACDKAEVYGEVELELGDGVMVQGRLLICQKNEYGNLDQHRYARAGVESLGRKSRLYQL